ncbi:MAG: diacylglycerol kinase [Rickettsiales bacterium]|jgi:diacylglycerol kinase (ATP)|nr:diacylglycerol kinase [Rickettsiales bacterium]
MNRILNALRYSCHGLKSAFASETSFRQDVAIFIIGTIAAIFIPVGNMEKCLLASSLLIIILMELANTAIETIINRISADIHPLSKKAKDIGSALVMLSFANAAVVWAVVLYPIVISN